jgi:Na+/melibiose symporter-like transporter
MVYQIMMLKYLILKHTYTETNITCSTNRTRLINNNTITIFQQLLKNETWECVCVNYDINGIFNAFLNTFLIFFKLVSLLNVQISIS